MEVMRRARDQHAVGIVHVIAWGMVPAIAALIGAALSLVWSAVLAIQRSATDQRMKAH
jgi:hypothetical protein